MIKRLTADELAHTAPRPILDSPRHRERARASAVIHELLPFLERDLALSPAQVDDLTLALERALERARTRDDGAGS